MWGGGHLNNLCLQKRFYCVKQRLLILDATNSFDIEHVYIITAECLKHFSEMNDNGNVLLENLLLSGKSLYLATWKYRCCRSNSCKEKGDFSVSGPNFVIKFDVGNEVSFTFKEFTDRFVSCCHEPYMINSVFESFIFIWFLLIQLLVLAQCFPSH